MYSILSFLTGKIVSYFTCNQMTLIYFQSRDVKHDDLVSCLVQEVTTLLRMSTIDEITSVYFGGGENSC